MKNSHKNFHDQILDYRIQIEKSKVLGQEMRKMHEKCVERKQLLDEMRLNLDAITKRIEEMKSKIK